METTVMDRKQLNAARRAKLKALMEEKGLSPAEVVDKLDIPPEEVERWRQYIYNVRSDSEMTGVPPERAEKLAPVFGVQVMDLLIEYTDRERNRMDSAESAADSNGETHPPAATQVVSTVSPNEVKVRRGEALNLLMTQRQLSSNVLASQLHADEYQASLLAMKLAEYRQGEELMPADLCSRIAEKVQVDPVSLFIELLPEEAPANPPPVLRVETPSPGAQADQPRRRGRRPGSGGGQHTAAPEQLVATPTERQGPTGETEVARITLSPTEFDQLLGCTVAIVQGQDGRYAARLPEKRLSKDDLIQILLKQLKK